MLGTIVRFLVSAIVLLMIAAIIPGVSISGFFGAIVVALVIAGLGYVAELLFGKDVSPRSRGLVGFITAAVVIYLAQFIVPSLISVSIVGALIAAFLVGLVDAFVPTAIR